MPTSRVNPRAALIENSWDMPAQASCVIFLGLREELLIASDVYALRSEEALA